MSAIWFVGDTHFGHQKVAELRGFTDVDAHDDHIAHKWIKQVGEDDLVYVLGDISVGSRTGEAAALQTIRGLPGKKVLISGNHDSVSSIHRKLSPLLIDFQDTFADIKDFSRIRVEGRNVLLSHYPYAATGDGPNRGEARYLQYRLPDLGLPLIHAHTHQSVPVNGREICVSWESWGRMVNLGDISRWIKGLEFPNE